MEQSINEAARQMGRKGGTNKNAKLTKEQRSAIGYQLAAARATKKARTTEEATKSIATN